MPALGQRFWMPYPSSFHSVLSMRSWSWTKNTSSGSYRFRTDEYFYRGHFPETPVTPGVVLVETMAQSGVVAMGIYLTLLEKKISLEEVRKVVTLFTMIEMVEFTGKVLPGERVIVHGEKVYFRRGSLKARTTMERENGEVVCSGILAGMEGIR